LENQGEIFSISDLPAGRRPPLPLSPRARRRRDHSQEHLPQGPGRPASQPGTCVTHLNRCSAPPGAGGVEQGHTGRDLVPDRGSKAAPLQILLRPHSPVPVSVPDGSSPTVSSSLLTTPPEHRRSYSSRAFLADFLVVAAPRLVLLFQSTPWFASDLSEPMPWTLIAPSAQPRQ
jgi:hypothetical protein